MNHYEQYLPGSHSPEITQGEFWRSEQPVEDRRRMRLFQQYNPLELSLGDFVLRVTGDTGDAHAEQVDYIRSLYEQFVVDKKATDNMGERFAMFMDKYIGKIGFFELAMIENPNDRTAIDAKSQEFHDLVDWLQLHNADITIPPKAGNIVYTSRPTVAAPDTCSVLERTRLLCQGTLPLDPERFGDGAVAKLMVAKMSTFVVLNKTLAGFQKILGEKYMRQPQFIEAMNAAMRTGSSPIAGSIRTAYYLEATPVNPNGELDHDD